EMGGYNRHYGWTNSANLILGNSETEKIILRDLQFAKDFIVHELTHHRQRNLLGYRASERGTRGVHRDRGWYGAIAEAAPRYLGVAFPESIWPRQKSVRKGGKVLKVQEQGRLTQVEV